MPIYTIEDEKGNRSEIYRTIARRDCLPKGWKRVFVPQRLAYLAGAIEPESPECAVPKAFRREENSGKNWREIERAIGLPRDEIRRTWNF